METECLLPMRWSSCGKQARRGTTRIRTAVRTAPPFAVLDDWQRRKTARARLKRSGRDACRVQVKHCRRPTLVYRFLAEAFSTDCRHEFTSQGSQRTRQIPY